MQIFKTQENSKAMIGEKENQLENLKLQINNLKMTVAT